MDNEIPSFERADYGTDHATDHGSSVPLDPAPGYMAEAEARQVNHAAYVRAILFGVGAAVVGCALYAGIEIATGWTIGYVGIAVGYLVGKAMRAGSGGRGGRRYQIAAAILTYASISMAAVPIALHYHRVVSDKVLALLSIGLASPFLELTEGVGGVIGLFILFISIRAAWQLMAGSESIPGEPSLRG
jgi:hypothetical protein